MNEYSYIDSYNVIRRNMRNFDKTNMVLSNLTKSYNKIVTCNSTG